jgi:hypothetical protein
MKKVLFVAMMLIWCIAAFSQVGQQRQRVIIQSGLDTTITNFTDSTNDHYNVYPSLYVGVVRFEQRAVANGYKVQFDLAFFKTKDDYLAGQPPTLLKACVAVKKDFPTKDDLKEIIVSVFGKGD